MIGLIGGTGLSSFDGLNIMEQRWVETPFGECSGPLLIGKYEGHQVAFLARHGDPHRIPPHLVNYRANLYAMRKIGVKRIVAVNAVGGIHPDFPPKSIAIPDQIIDYTYGREHTIYDGIHCEDLDHIDFTLPYSEEIRTQLIELGSELQLDMLKNGVYGATQGPRLESPAEIRRLANDGCDMVGMTGMPEASLAKELGLEYACIAISVNWAAGITDDPITMDEIHNALEQGIGSVKQLISSYLRLNSKA